MSKESGLILEKTYELLISSGPKKLSVTGCVRIKPVYVERGSTLVAIFESISPAKTGVLVTPSFWDLNFWDVHRLGC